MSASVIEVLASAWARIAEGAGFPTEYEGTPTPDAHSASGAIEQRIREHIIATNDMRLLGQASLSMERVLWLVDYERITRQIEKSLQEADNPNAKSHTHEEVMQRMRERIDRAKSKPNLA